MDELKYCFQKNGYSNAQTILQAANLFYLLIDTWDVSDQEYLPDWKINQSVKFVFGLKAYINLQGFDGFSNSPQTLLHQFLS